MHLATRKDLIYPRVATLQLLEKVGSILPELSMQLPWLDVDLAKLSSLPTLIFVLIGPNYRRVDTISRLAFPT